MADVVVTGAGMTGLSAAMLLAADGHTVTVVEQDPSPPPTPDDAWAAWERKGVGQFRMLHILLSQWRRLAEVELPAVVEGLTAAGGLRFNPIDHVAPELRGPRLAGDDDLTMLTARRPMVEWVMASVAERTPGVTIRRGVTVAGLAVGASAFASASADGDVPHVTGLVTSTGETIEADVVVDATGRRSPLRRWLEAAGARPIVEEEEDLGFVYYGRHFRAAEGAGGNGAVATPMPRGPLLMPFDSLSILTLPADNGTWGVGFVTSGRDAALRRLKDDDVWMRALRAYPLAAHWADGEPLDDVAVMARLPDRYRRFVVDGVPVVTGLLAVGDSWACTNPSLGRGITMGLAHALALRDMLRTEAIDDPGKLALAWDEATETTVGPWYRATLAFDRHRLAEIDAQIAGEPYEPDNPEWEITKALTYGVFFDRELYRGFQRLVGMVDDVSTVLAAPGFLERVIAVGAGWRDAPPIGPRRTELLEVIGA